jgi:Zyg-11 family protein
METAWSCMWNVTDETPINCQRFLDGGGMQLFLNCKEKFPNAQDLLRNMMGLLGNVAEVPALRSQLMTKEFVTEFSQLLGSNTDGIEVSGKGSWLADTKTHMARYEQPFEINRLTTNFCQCNRLTGYRRSLIM